MNKMSDFADKWEDIKGDYGVSPSNENVPVVELEEISQLIGKGHSMIMGTGSKLMELYAFNENPDAVCVSYDYSSGLFAQLLIATIYPDFKTYFVPGYSCNPDREGFYLDPENIRIKNIAFDSIQENFGYIQSELIGQVIADFDGWFYSLVRDNCLHRSAFKDPYSVFEIPEKREVILQGVKNRKFQFKPKNLIDRESYEAIERDVKNLDDEESCVAYFSNTLEYVLAYSGQNPISKVTSEEIYPINWLQELYANNIRLKAIVTSHKENNFNNETLKNPDYTYDTGMFRIEIKNRK